MASLPDPQPAVPLIRVAQPDPSSLAALLQYEGDVRRQASVNELVYFVANESRRIVAYDQLFVLRQARASEGFHVIGASSIALVDRNAPLIHALETILGKLPKEAPQTFDATAYSDDPSISEYPFHAWHWQPIMGKDGKPFAGLLIARTVELREAEGVRLVRMSETIGHSWLALTSGKPVMRLPRLNSKKRRWIAAGLVIAALFPVRMTALAPVEVVPARPYVISAPYAGVIQRIDVAPNALVKAGQPVLTFEDIKVRNELQQATEKLAVARAKVERATSAAFAKADEARDIGPLQAEYDLAKADYAYAKDIMGKSQIAAPRAGMAIYSDRRDWEGRAVNVGDPILQIASPQDIAYRIDLPTKEQMTLKPGAPVKVWLDAQPLWSLDGVVEQASYQARPTADGILAFAVSAKPVGDTPRIGSRGTAKLYGQWVPFAYSVFRRPMASARQYLGL
jgi:multidrug resistance efflux pump